MNILQINLQHSKAASANLLIHLEQGGADIVLIQEPWLSSNGISGLRTRSYKLVAYSRTGKPRSCILIRKELNAFILPNFSNEDIVTASLEGPAGKVWLMSAYMAHDDEVEPPPVLLREALAEAKRRKVGVIIGTDANSHHTCWGSSNINARGESLFDYILNEDLFICNRGKDPTFITAAREEVLDLTLASSSLITRITDWRVLNAHSFSDHRYIQFSLTQTRPIRSPYRNLRRTDWDAYYRNLLNLLPNAPGENLDLSEEAIDELVETFTAACNKALETSCPIKAFSRKEKPPWWTTELSELRASCRRLFNRAKRIRSPSGWELYKAGLGIYKSEIRKAKKDSWRSFCESVEGCHESSRFRRVLTRSSAPLGYLRDELGRWAMSGEESLKLLLDAHFPTSQAPSSTGLDGISTCIPDRGWLLDKRRLAWAIDSFGPFKSPGPDGIIPAQLQKSVEVSCRWLSPIYASCVARGYIPGSWRAVRVVFIPKAGKSSHVSPKDFRPISLSSFLLKTLERLIDLHIRSEIPRGRLSHTQHAYCKGRSVESALHTIVKEVEESLFQKEFAVGAFLDIEGAFNNVLPEAITRSLGKLGVGTDLIRFIHKMLSDRTVAAEWGGISIHRQVRRGTPQGGVLSPFLWVVVLNDLLEELVRGGCRVIAYADDVALIVRGKFVDTLYNLMQGYLNTVVRWATDCGLSMNPLKTELVLFTRKYKIPGAQLPSLGGAPLMLSDKVRYLGIILDSKLTWRPNIEERVRKATIALYGCKGAIGKRWGLSPRVVFWLYNTIVKPILLYGVIVWWNSLERTTLVKKLERVQRSALIGISGALRTTPTLALNAMLNVVPVDIAGRIAATRTAIRLRDSGYKLNLTYGHSSILRNFEFIPLSTDQCIPSLSPTGTFSTHIPSREEWTGGYTWGQGLVNLFTDGSKLEGKVGGGVFCEELPIRFKFRLPDHCSVFQAEVAAIKEAADWLLTCVLTVRKVNIYSDSQAAIRALGSVTVHSKLVRECLTSLSTASEFFDISLIWVPGHSDIAGNCEADELARQGTCEVISPRKERIGIPLTTCGLLLERWASRQLSERWASTQTCKVAKSFWPRVDRGRSGELLRLTKYQLSNLVGFLTGHYARGMHAVRLGITSSPFCDGCMEDEVESSQHLLLSCPALAGLRSRHLGSYFFATPADIAGVDIRNLMNFISSTKRLTQTQHSHRSQSIHSNPPS